MSDQFTEVTTQGWLSRLGGSLIAALIGLLLVPASVALLYWNEGRAVDALRALNRGAAAVMEVAAEKADPQTSGQLVHVTGMLQATTPARDPVFGVSGDGLIRLHRIAEMYQWQEHSSSRSHESVGGSKTTETTYTYDHVWSDRPISSSGFHYSGGHQNPAMPIQSTITDAAAPRLGGWQLDTAVLDRLTNFVPLDPSVSAPSGWQADGAGFYRGADASQPAVGDVRVRFAGIAGQTVSIVAGQSDDRLTPYRDRNGYTIALLEPGVVPAVELFHDQMRSEKQLTWILRGAGFVVMLIGFICIFKPLTTLLAVLPPLEWVASGGVFLTAVALALPITLITIGIAWVAHRPLIGGGLIVLALGSVVALRLVRPAHRHAPAH
jgi:hypothetical protein